MGHETLVVGHTTHDRYEEDFVAGGCAFYAARVSRSLGGDVRLATLVGEDFTCDDAIADLPGVVVRHGNTTLFTNLYPDNAPRLQLLEAWAPMMRPEMFGGEMLSADLVHLAPVLGEIDLVEWRQAVEAELLAISVQGWIKAPDPKAGARMPHVVAPEGADVVAQKPWDVSTEELEGVDVACLSDEDLRNQGDLLDRLTEAVPVVTLTHGTDGATVFVEGTRREIGVYETDAVDPTGAGDTFASAFLDRYARGAAPVDAARFAAATASIVVEGRGSRELERVEEARERRESVPVKSR